MPKPIKTMAGYRPPTEREAELIHDDVLAMASHVGGTWLGRLRNGMFELVILILTAMLTGERWLAALGLINLGIRVLFFGRSLLDISMAMKGTYEVMPCARVFFGTPWQGSVPVTVQNAIGERSSDPIFADDTIMRANNAMFVVVRLRHKIFIANLDRPADGTPAAWD